MYAGGQGVRADVDNHWHNRIMALCDEVDRLQAETKRVWDHNETLIAEIARLRVLLEDLESDDGP